MPPVRRAELRGFRGELLGPEDAGHDRARRLWNGAVDKRPALIARCTGAADVRAGIGYARAGGSAWAEGGLLWGELDQATQRFGLATTGGIVTHTGVAGLTLGGGIGWLMRKHGLTCDNLLVVELVTAEGRRLRVDRRTHPELFWGSAAVLYPAEQAGQVLRGYRDWAAGAPDEVSTVVNLRLAPALPIIPERLQGRPVVTITCCYAGDDPATGERLPRIPGQVHSMNHLAPALSEARRRIPSWPTTRSWPAAFASWSPASPT